MNIVDLENLTIIIITYNRYNYLKRLLNFFISFKSDLKILVLDSSSKKILNQNIISLLKSKNILWKKYDSEIFFPKKIADACKLIDTKYTVLCADDDFIFPNALKKCINFLDNNNEFSSCFGVHYKHFSKKFFFKNILCFEKKFSKNFEISDDTSYKRIKKYLSMKSIYYPMYSVHRTLDFKKIWVTTSQNVTYWGLSEIFPCILSLCIGKMKILDTPYTSRERNSFVWSNKKTLEKMYSPKKIEIVKHKLAQILTEYEKTSLEENIKYSDEIFKFFLKKIFRHNKFNYNHTYVYKFYFLFKKFFKLYLLGWKTNIDDLDTETMNCLLETIKKNETESFELQESRKNYFNI